MVQSSTESVSRKVRRFLDAEGARARVGGICVGVSGGADSLMLLYVLRHLGIKPLFTAHLDHALRAESRQDRRFVEELCREWEIPLRAERRELLVPGNRSPEAEARRERYRFLEEAARSFGAGAVAVGHTLDDQAQTVLMRLKRGCGLRGLRAILPCRPIRFGSLIRLLRPLLECTRRELEAAVQHLGLVPREDPSNQDLRFLRNRIRLKTLPALEKILGNELRFELANLARWARQSWEVTEREAERVFPEILASETSDGFSFHLDPLQALPSLVRFACLLRAGAKLRQGQFEPTRSQWERVEELILRSATGKQVELPGGIRVLRHARTLELGTGIPLELPMLWASLQLPGEVQAGSWHVSAQEVELERARESIAGGEVSPLEAFLDAARIPSTLTLRTWRPGDRFHPLGSLGVKKLSRYFIDRKLPATRRGQVPLLAEQQQVVWLIGYQISHGARITDQTSRCVHLRAEPRTG